MSSGRYAHLLGTFWRDPKILALSHVARSSFASMLSYSADNMSDGLIPHAFVGAITHPSPPEKPIAELEKAGLVKRVSDGVQVTKYLKHNMPKAEAERRLAAHARRQAKYEGRLKPNAAAASPDASGAPSADASLRTSGHQDIRTSGPKESDRAEPSLARQAREVFGVWQALCSPRAKPDRKRLRTIEARLREGHAVETLKLVPAGALKTPWNAGENPDGRRYLDVGLLFRDAEHVERFAAAAKAPSGGAAKSPDFSREILETRLKTARTFGRIDEIRALEQQLGIAPHLEVVR